MVLSLGQSVPYFPFLYLLFEKRIVLHLVQTLVFKLFTYDVKRSNLEKTDTQDAKITPSHCWSVLESSIKIFKPNQFIC